jgi:hypothetical protein
VDLDQVQSAATWIPVSGGLRADYFFDERSREAPPQIRAGDRIEMLLRARLVRNFADPGVTDHRALMAGQDIYLTGSLRNTTLIEKIPGPPPTIANRLARARGRLLSETDAMLAGSPGSAAVARAMLLGDRSFLDSQQIDAFRDTGVYPLTHAHEDHYGDMASVLRNFQVGEIWLGHDADWQGYRALLAEAHALNLRIVRRVKGDTFDRAGVLLDVLWPADDAPVKTASNNDSLVIRLKNGQQTMLLTGDIENPVERKLAADGDPLSADFLKVPHHGSKTSSTQGFLDAVRPHLAVISVGDDNGFGQPNTDVLDRIQQEGARLYRTDRDGAVTALSDGRQVTVHSFLERP